jgi:hypothetical protein
MRSAPQRQCAEKSRISKEGNTRVDIRGPTRVARLAEALEGRCRRLGYDHPDVASILRWLSELRPPQGRLTRP